MSFVPRDTALRLQPSHRTGYGLAGTACHLGNLMMRRPGQYDGGAVNPSVARREAPQTPRHTADRLKAANRAQLFVRMAKCGGDVAEQSRLKRGICPLEIRKCVTRDAQKCGFL